MHSWRCCSWIQRVCVKKDVDEKRRVLIDWINYMDEITETGMMMCIWNEPFKQDNSGSNMVSVGSGLAEKLTQKKQETGTKWPK